MHVTPTNGSRRADFMNGTQAEVSECSITDRSNTEYWP
jgi:hypothetical protein